MECVRCERKVGGEREKGEMEGEKKELGGRLEGGGGRGRCGEEDRWEVGRRRCDVGGARREMGYGRWDERGREK